MSNDHWIKYALKNTTRFIFSIAFLQPHQQEGDVREKRRSHHQQNHGPGKPEAHIPKVKPDGRKKKTTFIWGVALKRVQRRKI